MKYISITFDDGRSDNYTIAKQIMDKYNLKGTIYITTGFIDNTWEDSDILESPTRPLNIDEIKKMKNCGWEIGLHGDKHKTEVEDTKNSLNKLKEWGIDNNKWGMSIPNSSTSEEEVKEIFEKNFNNKIVYIRRGRNCNTKSIKYKILFILYSLFKFKWAYRLFNKENIVSTKDIKKINIPSVVIKFNDSPEMIMDFIKYVPDNSIIVFMFHSILYSTYKKNSWSWSEKKFEKLCFELKKMQEKKRVNIVPLIDVILKN